ncbi:MAG TPA: FtsX-like permease family protein [Phycisphaerae bacterium]|nr:FtsX-like permease family protein [Phycisphaerae bacterium]
MTPGTLQRRSLNYHWRMHAALALCAMVGSAALTGALLVGDSMRGSLREMALKRIGPVQYSLRSNQSFSQDRGKELGGCKLLLFRGAAEHAVTGARANLVQILGLDHRDDDFFLPRTLGERAADAVPAAAGRTVTLNAALARELGAIPGDDILLRLNRPALVPAESLLGRPDEQALSLRLTVEGIAQEPMDHFSLEPAAGEVFNALVPLDTLQDAVEQRARANTILWRGPVQSESEAIDAKIAALRTALSETLDLSDYGLRLRVDFLHGYVSLESAGVLLDRAVEDAALAAARSMGAEPAAVLSYLANDIVLTGKEDGVERRVPYSIVAGVDDAAARQVLGHDGGGRAAPLGDDEIVLNQWAADDLGARPGDRIRLVYYVSGAVGKLEERSHEFLLKAIAPLVGRAADPGFLPNYRGISDADTLADWDPPPQFKIDLKRIRDKDEDYWRQYKGTPKAFISLRTGQRLWTEADSRFGRLTAIQMSGTPGRALDTLASRFETALRERIDPARMGFVVDATRRRALEAGAGSTDFGMLFISFSFFIIAAAALLVGLVFRLNLERRAAEVGLLRALGYSLKRLRRIFIVEGLIVAVIGSALGLLAATGYAWAMLAGLRSLWNTAVNAPFLSLHASSFSFLVGFAASVAIAAASLYIAMRGLAHFSVRSLLSGVVAADRHDGPARTRGLAILTCAFGFAAGAGLIVTAMVSEAIPKVVAFFASGGAVLVGGVAAVSLLMSSRGRTPIQRGGPVAMVRLGLRNAVRRRGRSLSIAAVIACASFIIIAVGASRHGVSIEALDRNGGAGGYSLIAKASVPLPYDPGSPSGRENLGLSDEAAAILGGVEVAALRLKPGDDASCLNLYEVTRPRILGAPPEFIARGGFSFQKSLAANEAERANPWTLLDRHLADGAIPAIGDANTLTWLLKKGLGEDFAIVDDAGRRRPLRIVAMLSGSVLQSELVISEEHFKRLFPGQSGYGMILIDAPHDRSKGLAPLLEHDLNRYGVDVTSTLDRINRFRAVENTYMSAFQMLGGIGLVLGTLGLGAVMLRNILERRGEFALLRALGYRKSRMILMVLVENAALLLAGLCIGSGSALIAVAPHLLEGSAETDWASLSFTMAAVFLAGMLSAGLAVRSAVRGPLLQALRRE